MAFADLGFPRMAARVLFTLLVRDHDEGMTAAELAEGASPRQTRRELRPTRWVAWTCLCWKTIWGRARSSNPPRSSLRSTCQRAWSCASSARSWLVWPLGTTSGSWRCWWPRTARTPSMRSSATGSASRCCTLVLARRWLLASSRRRSHSAGAPSSRSAVPARWCPSWSSVTRSSSRARSVTRARRCTTWRRSATLVGVTQVQRSGTREKTSARCGRTQAAVT